MLHPGQGKGLHSKGGTYNAKFGAHLIRLVHAGIRLAETGEVMVRVDPPLRETLLKIRRDEISEEGVVRMARPLLEELSRRSRDNRLPERPERSAIDDLVVRARLSRG